MPDEKLKELAAQNRDLRRAYKDTLKRLNDLNKDVQKLAAVRSHTNIAALGGREVIRDYGDNVWARYFASARLLLSLEPGDPKFRETLLGMMSDWTRLYAREARSMSEKYYRERSRVRMFQRFPGIRATKEKRERYLEDTLKLHLLGGAPQTVWLLFETTPQVIETGNYSSG